MSESSKGSDGTLVKYHPVRWDRADFERIEEAARIISAREHLDLTATDIIRSGTRRFVEEIIDGAMPSERAAS